MAGGRGINEMGIKMERHSFNLRLRVSTERDRPVFSRVEWKDETFSLIFVDRKTEEPIAMATLTTQGVVFEEDDILRVRVGNRIMTHTVDEPPQEPIRFDFKERDLIPVEDPPDCNRRNVKSTRLPVRTRDGYRS